MRLALLLWTRWAPAGRAPAGTINHFEGGLMLSKKRDMWAGAGCDAGFTAVEVLIVILIIGILSAVALPLYLGYTRDARLAEAKGLAGSTPTAPSRCRPLQGARSTRVRRAAAQRVGVGTCAL